jgi:hypothetical protein
VQKVGHIVEQETEKQQFLKNEGQQPKASDKQYDSMMSALIGRNPQAFLDFLYQGSRFVGHHRNKLADTQRQPDAIIEAKWNQTGGYFIAHPEIQTAPEEMIAERLLDYQVLIRRHFYHVEQRKIWVPVRSVVLHLTKAHEKMEIPLRWNVPNEQGEEEETMRFSFQSVEMRQKTPDDLLHLGHAELLPLLPATEGGGSRQMVEMVMEKLLSSGSPELAYYAYLVAGLTYKFQGKKEELQWLRRRYKMIDEKFRHSPVYQWTLDEGIAIGEERGIAIGEERGIAIGEERGIAIGEERGREQARQQSVQAAQHMAISIVAGRFAELAQLASVIISSITDLKRLEVLVIELSVAASQEDAKRLLLSLVSSA